MKRRATAAFAATCWLAASASAAQTAPAAFVDPASGLSLDQAIQRALTQEPSIRAARTSVDAARGMRLQAGLRKNLSISTELRDEPAGTDHQTMVSVEWPLDLFRRTGRVNVADREVAAAELLVSDRERLLAADVRARYGDALVAVREAAVLDDLVAATRRQADLLRARVDQGASPALERDLMEVELRRLEADRLLQLGRAERAMFELKRAIGAPPDEQIRLRDVLDDVVNRQAPAATAGTGAAEGRADVREAQARVAVADARIDRARREGRVDVSVFAGYTRMDSGFSQIGLSPAGGVERIRGQFQYVTGGVMVTLPLFNRNQGEVAAARAERAGAAALHAAAALTAGSEIAAARALDERARDAVRMYGAEARTLARQNLSVVQQSYGLGRATIFEVLSEQKRYLDLERAYTGTLREAFEARTALNRALGAMQ
ncbi:MAG TPA: TolC family protein [Vicinamibacterales bacterium]|nr:TolC family protein [Vicinamibacterales bacterium]